MKKGIHISAGVVRLSVLAALALFGAIAFREYPEVRRYMKVEKM